MFAESENIMEEQRNWKKDFLPLRKDLYYIFLESTFKPYQEAHTNKIYFEFYRGNCSGKVLVYK